MFGWVRLLVVGFAVLSVIYVLLSIRARRAFIRRLEREYDAGGITEDRETYIARGLAEYRHSLRHRLLLGVYVVPLALLILVIYVVNFM